MGKNTLLYAALGGLALLYFTKKSNASPVTPSQAVINDYSATNTQKFATGLLPLIDKATSIMTAQSTQSASYAPEVIANIQAENQMIATQNAFMALNTSTPYFYSSAGYMGEKPGYMWWDGGAFAGYYIRSDLWNYNAPQQVYANGSGVFQVGTLRL